MPLLTLAMTPSLNLAMNFCGLVNGSVIHASPSDYILILISVNVLGSRSVRLLSVDSLNSAIVFCLGSFAVAIGL